MSHHHHREVIVKRLIGPSMTMSIVLALTLSGLGGEPEKAEKAAVKTKKVGAQDIVLNVPEGWKQKPQVREPRIVEFEVPPAGDEKESGEFVVFYFGKQGAGGVQANIDRWIGQLDEEGRKVRIATGESTDGKYTLVDLTGIYNKSIGPPIAKKTKRLPGWRVLNAVIETEAGPYFLKLDGPEKLIAAVEDDFRAAFGGKKETEKERKAK
jgi:gluconolactonase